jgi:alpha-glucosidase
VMRTLTRFGGKNASPMVAKLMMAILMSLRGTALIYQGEELGLPQAELARDQLKDPVGDLYYPYTGGRDGCRTPMPWDAAMTNLGFSTGTPWLPLPEAHKDLSASLQMKNSASMLNFTRGFLIARKKFPELRWGEIEFLDAPSPILCFIRTLGTQRIIAAFNMSDREAEFSAAEVARAEPLGIGFGSGTRNGPSLKLGPYGARFGRI